MESSGGSWSVGMARAQRDIAEAEVYGLNRAANALKMENEQLRKDLKEADKVREQLVAAMQSVVMNWTSQFERNGHLAPQWVKDARSALLAAGVTV